MRDNAKVIPKSTGQIYNNQNVVEMVPCVENQSRKNDLRNRSFRKNYQSHVIREENLPEDLIQVFTLK